MISVITPVHAKSVPFLAETFESLKAQTFTDWKWLIGLNAGGYLPEGIASDPRVKVFALDDEPNQENAIGRLKHQLCQKATGEIIVELDADDILTPDALATVAEAFQNPQTVMVYSNCCEFKHETWEPQTYGAYWGWRSRDFEWQGHALKEMIAWEPSPHMMRQVFWAPNHIRAWRATAYQSVGGHDEKLAVGDDHDLCCRLFIAYGARAFKHIDRTLYLYRVHGQNAVTERNAAIQKQTEANYLKYVRDMAKRWARDEGTRLLDLGGRFNAWDGLETVDRLDADVIADLNGRWPFEDNSVGVIHAAHIFEHLTDSVHTMNEAYRVLAPGGFLFIEVPSTDGRGAWQDPTHVSYWNSNSIWYYTDRNFARFIQPEYVGRFQKSFVTNYYPSEFEKLHHIPIMLADLIALKPPYDERPAGEVLI